MNLVVSGLSGKRRRGILHRCRNCDHHFSETAGTIFHDTRLNIRDWFLAIYLIGSIEKGVRPAQLETYLGIGHETALKVAALIQAEIKKDGYFVQRYVRLPELSSGSIEPPAANRGRHPTLPAIVHKFGTKEGCRAFLEQIRWPNGPLCLRCKKPEVRKIRSKGGRTGNLYRCPFCKYQFSVTTNTLLGRTHLLSEWLIAIYLTLASRGKAPAKQLQRLLGVNYGTATKMIQSLRTWLSKNKHLLETYIGYNDLAKWTDVETRENEGTQATGE